MATLTADQIANSGVRMVYVGEAMNVWEFPDENTGELRRGVKLRWFGGNGSVRLSEADHKRLKVGDFVRVEVVADEKDGKFKPSDEGCVVEVNGKPVSNLTGQKDDAGGRGGGEHPRVA